MLRGVIEKEDVAASARFRVVVCVAASQRPLGPTDGSCVLVVSLIGARQELAR